MKTSFHRIARRGIALCFLAPAAALALAPVASCPSAPTNNDFKMTTLVDQAGGNLQEPLRMDFDLTSSGVDIYFVEKAGKVRRFNASNNSVTNLGTISVRTTGEHGLLGIALDPGFKTNHRLYLYYGSGSGAYEFRVSRFTLAGDQIDMNSEKIMLRVPADNNQWHTGGAMAFDPKGNLWVTVGDNASDEGGAPNTNDYRGKILRIHPSDDGTYTVPDGNLFPAGTDKTKPEVFIMGDRNPYSVAIDPKTNWVVWGEVGPDGFGQTEEFNLATKPGNYGWPYFAGNNQVLKSGKVPSAPVNNSNLNTGLTNLPPAIPATYWYQQDCAISGPLFRYNAAAASSVHFPPHYDGLWFVTDFNNYGVLGETMDTMSVDDNGKPGKLGRIWSNWKLSRPTQFALGPDGALYAMNYSGYFSTVSTTAIVRIDYTGTCRPPIDQIIAVKDPLNEKATGRPLFDLAGSRLSARTASGDLALRDLSGRTVYSRRLEGAADVDLKAATRRPGLYAVSLTSGGESYSRTVLIAP